MGMCCLEYVLISQTDNYAYESNLFIMPNYLTYISDISFGYCFFCLFFHFFTCSRLDVFLAIKCLVGNFMSSSGHVQKRPECSVEVVTDSCHVLCLLVHDLFWRDG